MHTSEELLALEPEQRTQLFERLAELRYGGSGWHVRVAEEMDVARPTVFRWKRTHTVPVSVIMLLEQLTAVEKPTVKLLPDFEDLLRRQHDVARNLAEAARAQADVAKAIEGLLKTLIRVERHESESE